MELIKVINYNIDINQLLKIVNSYVYKDLPLRMDGFSVQTRLNVLDPWNLIDGLESLKLYPKGTVEQDFKFLNQIFKNTIIEKIVCDLNLFRTRVMVKNQKTCYSFHQDGTWRVHIPIITDPQCVFYFPEHGQRFHLEVGKVYKINTTETHTFINGSKQQRIHLIGCVNS
jgi:hypothetical protein|tara:strand:- start:9049 stop:9558 length:510 start_codon:yes stop_codon:yes gene_type:complete